MAGYTARRGRRRVVGMGLVGKPRPGLATPAPAPALAPAAPTFDSSYYNDTGLSNRSYESRIADIDQQERAVKFDFGFDDPTNPFSRIAELKRRYLQQGQRTTAGLAAGGHLYSSSHQNEQAFNRRNEEGDTSRLRSAYQNALNSLAAARTQAGIDRDSANNAAYEAWLGRAPAVQPGEAPAPAPAAPRSQVGPRIKNNKGHWGRWHTRPDGTKTFVLE